MHLREKRGDVGEEEEEEEEGIARRRIGKEKRGLYTQYIALSLEAKLMALSLMSMGVCSSR
jgi:hypothetical protein